MNIYDEITERACRNIEREIGKIKTSAYIPLISEWAQESRYLPAGTTEFPGLVDHSIAPHLVEIQDCLHPDSGVKLLTVMKGNQALVTTAIENAIGHSIKYKLHNILYIISSKNIAGIRSSSAIDVMIDHSRLAEFIKPLSTRMKRKVADNKYYKEMHGGRRLMLTSWNSVGDSKSLTWSFIIMDELEEAPYELKDLGDPETLLASRGRTIRDLKIAKMSTPSNTQGRIYRNFLEGDQRFYFCQCPICGEMQVMELKGLGREWGLTADSETIDKVTQIIPETVRYICKFNGCVIKEHQKGAMLTGGEWRPTARPINPEYRSYHISNLMSPVMFYSWVRVMQDFCETDWGQNITKFKNFVIDVLGWPWEHRSEKKSWQELQRRAEKYPLRIVPDGGLILTGGADIQKNRIELQVVAWGRGMTAWVIDYQIFWGETRERRNPVWTELSNYLKHTKYKIKNREIPIARTAIDSGYNPKNPNERTNEIDVEHIVYDFVATNRHNTMACRGSDMRDEILKQQQVKRKSLLKIRYDMASDELKDEIMIHVDVSIDEPGAIHFSNQLPEEYFKGFLSEVFAEVEPNKWKWKKIYERNEPLDTFILARAAAELENLPKWREEYWILYENRLFA